MSNKQLKNVGLIVGLIGSLALNACSDNSRKNPLSNQNNIKTEALVRNLDKIYEDVPEDAPPGFPIVYITHIDSLNIAHFYTCHKDGADTFAFRITSLDDTIQGLIANKIDSSKTFRYDNKTHYQIKEIDLGSLMIDTTSTVGLRRYSKRNEGSGTEGHIDPA
ncbi:MAG: hypothetical protein WC755_05125 [Candidatus Woesearchaeota archaeon]|jgi:hypothetical protein